MRWRSGTAVAVFGVIVILGFGSRASASSAMKYCDYRGPAWNLNGQQGDVWNLSFQKTTCAFGKTWAKKLALARNPKQYGAKLAGSPRGWRCQSLAGTTAKTAFSGSCTRGEHFFSWHPAY